MLTVSGHSGKRAVWDQCCWIGIRKRLWCLGELVDDGTSVIGSQAAGLVDDGTSVIGSQAAGLVDDGTSVIGSQAAGLVDDETSLK